MACCISPRICLPISSQGRHRSLIEHLQPAQPCQSTWHTHFISLNLTKPHSIRYYYSHCTDEKKRLEKLNQLAQSKHLINGRAAHSYPLNHSLSTADNFHTLLFFFLFSFHYLYNCHKNRYVSSQYKYTILVLQCLETL